MNKRGLSMVITTLIIILLVLVAIGIVWVVVRNIIQSGVEGAEISAKCLNIDVKATAVSCSDGTCDVTFSRTGSTTDAIAGIKLVFFNATNHTSSVIDVSGNIAPLATVTKSVDGEIINSNKIEVTAYFEDTSGIEKPCSQTTSFNIGAGSGGNGEIGNGESCVPESDPCGSWVCGNVENGTCGTISCGICESGDCVEGVCEGCIPDCTEKECGSDGCGENENCGTCPLGECVEGVCIIETSVNTGTVDSVWPPGAVKYFDSDDLPKNSTVLDYILKYVKFTGSETRCLQITWAEYLDEPAYNKSYLRLIDVADIIVEDGYEIWETQEGCES